MSRQSIDRRTLLRRATAATAGWLVSRGAVRARAVARGGAMHPIRIGAPVFDAPQDPEPLAMAHRRLGYRAAYCPRVDLNDAQRIGDIARAFAKHDVAIAEVGRWCNLLDGDPDKRAANRRRVIEGLALAERVGARCCVDIAGSYSTEAWYGPHPDNLSQRFFEETVENARAIIDAVKPQRTRFCFEMMGWAIPDSPDAYLRLIEAVDRKAFGVHLDPCNLINSPSRFYRNGKLIEECFQKLGPWIASCHAKDVAWDVEMQVHFREVPLGAGSVDYRTYLRCLASVSSDPPPLMIEHMKGPEQYDQSRRHLFAVAEQAGVPILSS